MSKTARGEGPLCPSLTRAYFEDQARPIGTGWRWVFAKVGPKRTKVLDPWNRYTVELPTVSRDPDKGWNSVRVAPASSSAPSVLKAVLTTAQKALRKRIIDAGDEATAFEAECLAVGRNKS
jgi:hypothetical protein